MTAQHLLHSSSQFGLATLINSPRLGIIILWESFEVAKLVA